MRAVILAAGRGSRLKHMTDDKPKCLVTVENKPLLFWQIDALRNSGIQNIAVVRGYKKEKIDFPGLSYFDNDHWEQTNMVSSLLCASSWLKESDCIISYSDIVYPSEVVKMLMASQGDIVITYDPNWLKLWKSRFDDPLSDAETFEINDRNELIEIGNRARSVEEIKGQYMGLLKVTPTGWNIIDQYLKDLPLMEVNKLDMTSLLQRLIKRNMTIHAVSIHNSWWFEIDHVRDLSQVRADLSRSP